MRAHNIGFDVLTEAYYKNRNVIVQPSIDGSAISWHNGQGSCYVSDLVGRSGMMKLRNSPFRQVYYDALDIGLAIHSPRTGQEIVFVVTREDKDAEGELDGWRLESLGPNGRPDGKYKLLVIND